MTEHEQGESRSAPKPLKAIHLIFEALDGDTTKLTFTPVGAVYELLSGFRQPLLPARPAEQVIEADAQPKTSKDSEAVQITGKLKSAPQDGRPDKQGRPTAWAKLAAHQEGEEGAHMYLASFHKGSVRIALSLEQEAVISVEGYIKPSQDPKKMDTLSVYRFLSYPGKPVKPQQASS